ncbi:OmpA family protein [Flavobacterium silvaticum]|uniref:OmpA family protein n=1 Tax=Flavobacterium silvaticum TaxID=1852020 RepID=A0A972FMQ6_9FLAO|nr:OmpA family protein [Flavobacterium silvaticum]NMH28876.1 OmpA family protein [Flavobacterium silvaticum]
MPRFFIQVMLLSTTIGFAQNKIEIYFETDSSQLTASAQSQLEHITADSQIASIYGYCDFRGSEKYNDSLSLKRAESVSAFLTNRGLSVTNNQIKGFGESQAQKKLSGSDRKVVLTFSQKSTDFKSRISSAQTGNKIVLKNLNFHNMSDKFLPESIPVVQELLGIMQANPKLRIEIQGHICCTIQSNDHYYGVSTARAKAVYDFLIQNGIDKSRLSYKGFGATRPLHPIPEKSEQERSENRRVEIEIIAN